MHDTRPARQTDRKYELTIGDYKTDEGILIQDLQITFDVQVYADNGKTANSATIEVYNLSRATLGKIETPYLIAALSVGYLETGTQLILLGNVVRTVTLQRGPDTVTQFFLGESYADLNHNRLKETIAPGKTYEDILEAIREEMPSVSQGVYRCDRLQEKLAYGYPLNGSPQKLLQKLCNALNWEWRVYLGSLSISERNAPALLPTGSEPIISNSTGLIGIPFYESMTAQQLPTDPHAQSLVRFAALLNPDVVPGDLLKLESSVLPQLNGYYRANAIRYTGDYRGNDWIMEVSANALPQPTTRNIK